MAEETKHVCQAYKTGKKGQLVLDRTVECRTAEQAKSKAQRLWDSATFAGVDAYTVTADPEFGEYGEPEFLARYGQVPASD